MKQLLTAALFFLTSAITFASFQPSPSKPVYVIVHGAWGGGWSFKKVDQLLTTNGNIVYRPTLTGQGEKVHLATKEVNLETHLNDIINTVLFEELEDIILVGHSYGGMVITGVADRIPEKIKKLIYVDAFVPEDNESVRESWSSRDGQVVNEMGYIVPSWVSEDKLPPKDVPHPGNTLTDKISLKNPERLTIPTTYILTVEKGLDPEADYFSKHAKRAEKKNWPIKILTADHNPQWSAPEEFVKVLENIVSQ
ncbi:MAG: alpha/beta hydrolase [Flavobacteriales bacterium MED-G15]|nr:MAG: alpha/beta hydrolase [Flavobacteriales bacterium MED-G15]|tara:strand:- start:8423 stop:9178 length:756 start_codon:yes stop_codon:yes gene_type:complete